MIDVLASTVGLDVCRVQADARVSVTDTAVLAAVDRIVAAANRKGYLALGVRDRSALVAAANLLDLVKPPPPLQRLANLCGDVLERRRDDLRDRIVRDGFREGVDAAELDAVVALVIDVCDDVDTFDQVVPAVRDRTYAASVDLLDSLGSLTRVVGDTIRHAHTKRTMFVLDALLAELRREVPRPGDDEALDSLNAEMET